MQSRTKSDEFRTESEKTVPLIEIVKEPETKTQPELKREKPLEKTALDLEDSSVLDLSVYKTGQLSTSQPVVLVYIRPFKEDIGKLLNRGKERISYIFRGVTPADLKNRFEEVLGDLRPDSRTKLKEEVFRYEYHIAQKLSIYISAKLLSRTLCN